MKKNTVRITVVILILMLLIVGYYTYLSNRTKSSSNDATMTVVDEVMSRNMQLDYPSTPKELIKYYNEIQRCFYNENCSDEQIEALGNRARELYDEDLLANNEINEYMANLKKEIQIYKDNMRTITGTSLAASTNVDYFEQDGFQFARIFCGYNVVDGRGTTQVREIFLLRRDENKRWKIYGWDLADNVNPQ